jgi:NADP-dependent alcohol dehydrogenase
LLLRFRFVSKILHLWPYSNRIFTKRQLQTVWLMPTLTWWKQYLTYPHEGYLQDRIAEGILQTWSWSQLWKTPKIMPWHLTLCGVVPWFKRLIKKGVPNDWATTWLVMN